MGWAYEVIASYELGGRAAADLREETSPVGKRLMANLIQHRIDHTHGHWRWPQPDPDLNYDGEGNVWSWQHAPCKALRWRTNRGWQPCEHYVHLTQEQAARHVHGEVVEVYCSWCSHDLEKHPSTTRPMERAA